MLRPYADALRQPGAAVFSAAGLVARLPMSMLGLGMVLLVSSTTGSYGLAGAVSAAGVVGSALMAPVQARTADRVGQHRLLLPLVGCHVILLTAFLVAVERDAPAAVLVVAAAAAGATLPQFGAMVRARWARLLRGTPRLHTAYALESVLDEVVFVVGPVLVTVLATGVHRLAGLGTTLLLTAGGGLALALQRRTQPAPHRPAPGVDRAALPVAALAVLVGAFVFMGGVFGSVELVVVAVSEDLGRRSASGLVLAAFATGSLLAGVVVGARRQRTAPWRRFLLGQAALGLAMLPLPFARSLWLLAALVFVAGFAISPTLITGFSLVESTVPVARLTEGLAWVGTALGAGVALGAALAGQVVEVVGPSAGFWVAVGCGALAAAVAVMGAVRPAPPGGRGAI